MKKLIVFISMGLLAVTNIVEADSPWTEIRVCNDTFIHGGALTMKVTGFNSQGDHQDKILYALSPSQCKDFYYNSTEGSQYINIHMEAASSEAIDDIQIGGYYSLDKVLYSSPKGGSVCNVRVKVVNPSPGNLYRSASCHGWTVG